MRIKSLHKRNYIYIYIYKWGEYHHHSYLIESLPFFPFTTQQKKKKRNKRKKERITCLPFSHDDGYAFIKLFSFLNTDMIIIATYFLTYIIP